VGSAFETTSPKRRRILGVFVMVAIVLLPLASEYLGTHDPGRFLLKAVALVVGLPLLIAWAFAVFRWSSQQRFGTLVPLFLGAVVAGLVFAGLLWAARLASFAIPALAPHYGPWGTVDVLRVGFALGLTSFAIWALAFVFPFAAEDARIRALEAEKLRSQVELAQLRSHLEPHFLLNTLNAISGLVTEDPREARRLLGTLGDLLRDLVAPEGEMQTLDEQLDWLRRYAQILETRHAGHLAFQWEVGGGTRQALLPRLLLQPLVENAVKHGALMRAGGGAITVRTELADGARLVCTIEDNGPGIPKGPIRPGAFGVLSVRRRLALRYADAATLRHESSPAGTRFVVELPLEQGRTS
jgi:signal transduction histidine kinase